VHTANWEAPLGAPNLPTPQAAHWLVPEMSALYLPLLQAVHWVEVAAPVSLPYLPTEQAVQAVAPVVIEL